MNNKSDLFDLKKEKQELDQFLSTIADAEEPASVPLKKAPAKKESQPVEIRKPFDHFELEKSDEAVRPIAPKDKPAADDNAFIPRFADTIPIRPSTDHDLKPKATSSFLPGDEEDQSVSKISAKGAKPLESLKTMPRFGAPSYFEEKETSGAPQEPPKIAPQESELEKKAQPVAPYDFAPEKKKNGVGKWIAILLIVFIAFLGLLFWLYPDTVRNIGETIKMSIPGAESVMSTGKSLISSSVPAVNLVNVRQRLVHNAKLGKSVRVIEGIVENTSPETISRIRISATLYDAGGASLATLESSGGNVLGDEKLETLDANAIQAVLQTGKGADDKIPPGGKVPFMIVFTDEPAGVFKMSVSPVNFEKH